MLLPIHRSIALATSSYFQYTEEFPPSQHTSRLDYSLSGLAITPPQVQPGEPARIAFDITNTGELPVNGTLHTEVRNPQGEEVQVFRLEVEALQPAASQPVLHTLGTTGLPEGSYSVVTYQLYGGE